MFCCICCRSKHSYRDGLWLETILCILHRKVYLMLNSFQKLLQLQNMLVFLQRLVMKFWVLQLHQKHHLFIFDVSTQPAENSIAEGSKSEDISSSDGIAVHRYGWQFSQFFCWSFTNLISSNIMTSGCRTQCERSINIWEDSWFTGEFLESICFRSTSGAG